MPNYVPQDYLDNFVGQERLKNEVSIYMEAMVHENLNLMIKGLSGYGKTYLAQIIFSYLFHKTEVSFYYYLCEKDMDEIETDIRNLFLDEVHVIKEPEFLYPILDSNKHNMVLATNEYYNLKEPLINRCINLQIEEYTEDNLAEISSRFFWKKNMEIPDEFAFRIAKVSRFPRETLSISKRLYIIFRSRGMPNSLDGLNNIIKNTLGIDEKGNISNITFRLDPNTRVYRGQLKHVNLTRDSDADMIPDFLDSNEAVSIEHTIGHLNFIK